MKTILSENWKWYNHNQSN